MFVTWNLPAILTQEQYFQLITCLQDVDKSIVANNNEEPRSQTVFSCRCERACNSKKQITHNIIHRQG